MLSGIVNASARRGERPKETKKPDCPYQKKKKIKVVPIWASCTGEGLIVICEEVQKENPSAVVLFRWQRFSLAQFWSHWDQNWLAQFCGSILIPFDQKGSKKVWVDQSAPAAKGWWRNWGADSTQDLSRYMVGKTAVRDALRYSCRVLGGIFGFEFFSEEHWDQSSIFS